MCISVLVLNLYSIYGNTSRDLEEVPLQTKSMRELEESKQVLMALNQHPVTRIRVIFPDQHVIQVECKPIQTVADVKAAIKPFLANTVQEFQLGESVYHQCWYTIAILFNVLSSSLLISIFSLVFSVYYVPCRHIHTPTAMGGICTIVHLLNYLGSVGMRALKSNLQGEMR